VTPDPGHPVATRGPASRRAARTGLALFLLSGLVAVGLALLATGCGGSDSRSGDTLSFTIPSGTTELLERGGSSDAIPEKITGRVGDTLVVVNRDESTQFIAGYSVSPGQTLKIPLNRSGDYITNCSAHKDKSIRMVVSE